MIIRATKKVLKMSGMNTVKRDTILADYFPGEWYVDLISLGKPGKFGLHFLHHPTLISVVVPGRSLNTIFQNFTSRTIDILSRQGYDNLIPSYQLDTLPEIFSTNNRSMIAYMNQVKDNSSYHCANTRNVENINYNWIENILFEYLFGTKDSTNKYITPQQILNKFKDQK
jgi:hypothetical protein